MTTIVKLKYTWPTELIHVPRLHFFSFHFADLCSQYEYDNVKYKLYLGSSCASYCKCTPLGTVVDGSSDYYWLKEDCPVGSKWNGFYGPSDSCDSGADVFCSDGKCKICLLNMVLVLIRSYCRYCMLYVGIKSTQLYNTCISKTCLPDHDFRKGKTKCIQDNVFGRL